MSTGRTRTRDLRSTHTGSFVRPSLSPNIVYRSASVGTTEFCNDIVGNRQGVNTFLHKRNDYGVQKLNGSRVIGGITHQIYSDMPIPEFINVILPSPNVTFGTLGPLKCQEYAWDLIAKTNPNQAHVNVPNFMAELRDWRELPSQVRRAGRSALRQGANANLTWRWGIKPFISDVNKLLDFTEAVEQRLRWLNKLADEKVLKRRARLDRKSVVAPPGTYFSSTSSGVLYQSSFQVTSTTKVWGTVQYRSTHRTIIPSSIDGRRKLARRLTTGDNAWSYVEAAWELLPWSWLADWFSNIGNVITALNNTIPIAWTKICIMRESTCIRRERVITPLASGLTLSGKYLRSEQWKERYPTFPFLPFHFSIPALTPGQWSILGSLSILKSRKGKGR